jgi:hypothetical protein
MVMMKNPENLDFETWPMTHGHNPAKVSKFKYKAQRKKNTTGLIELAAVMATDKVSRKAGKASKAFIYFI